MDFALTEEQRMIGEAARAFVERELMPHEETVERAGEVPREVFDEVRAKARAAGFFALNMPAELGGGGLDAVTLAVVDRAMGRTSAALAALCNRPARILLGCTGDQVETYLKPTIRGERIECFALTEPGAGSDARAIATRAERAGDDWVINGTKQFISHADLADFLIVFAVTGLGETPRGPRKRLTAFLVDKATPGVSVSPLACVATRGYNPNLITFTDVRVPDNAILGEEGRGFEVANDWLYAGRVSLAAGCVGRADRVLEMACEWAATRVQFGQPIGRFQGVSFQLADMGVGIAAAWALTLDAAWKGDQGRLTRLDASMANLYASEMLGRVTDAGVQVFGGSGLMADLPLERFWRDARVERIWEGTSEVQRHIIARDLLRPREA